MAKKYLDGPKVACGFVNERRLCTAQRMGAIFLRRQPDCSDPLVHQPGVLTGAQMTIVHYTAWKGVVIDRPAASLKPSKQAGPCVSGDLELDGSACLLLDYHRPSSNGRSRHERADLDLHQIAASKLAVDSQVKKCSVPHPSLSVKEEAN